jgi:hypothetical protein
MKVNSENQAANILPKKSSKTGLQKYGTKKLNTDKLKNPKDLSPNKLIKKSNSKLKELAKKAKDKIGDIKISDKFKDAASSTISTLSKIPSPSIIPLPSSGNSDKVDEAAEIKKLEEEKEKKLAIEKKESLEAASKEADKVSKIVNKKPAKIKKPAIFFVGGARILGSDSGYGGIRDMAEAVKGSKYYKWEATDKIVEDIKKRDLSQPVILVGHSFGGDTVIQVAKELNTLENAFRQVDLLVTIDSVGFNNDIVPPNVRTNLNFIGQSNTWLNDEPNIARDAKLTQVTNFLRNEDHTELDNSTDVQREILTNITNILKRS